MGQLWAVWKSCLRPPVTGGKGCLSSVTRRMRVHLRPVGVGGGRWVTEGEGLSELRN